MAAPGPDRGKILRQQHLLFVQQQQQGQRVGGKQGGAAGQQAGGQGDRTKRRGGGKGGGIFVYCRVCRRNHEEGRRHVYSAAHKARLEALLLKALARLRQAVTFEEPSLPSPPPPPGSTNEIARSHLASSQSTDGGHRSEDPASATGPILIGPSPPQAMPSPPEAPAVPVPPQASISNSSSAALEFLQLNAPARRNRAQTSFAGQLSTAPAATPAATQLRALHQHGQPGAVHVRPLLSYGQPAADVAGPSFGRSARRFGSSETLNPEGRQLPSSQSSAAPGHSEVQFEAREGQAHQRPALKEAVPDHDEGGVGGGSSETPSRGCALYSSKSAGKGWWCPFCEQEVGGLQQRCKQQAAQLAADQVMEAHMALVVRHVATNEHLDRVSCFWDDCVGNNPTAETPEHLQKCSFILDPDICADWAKRNPRSWAEASEEGAIAGAQERSFGSAPERRPAATDAKAVGVRSSIEQLDQKGAGSAQTTPFAVHSKGRPSLAPMAEQIALPKPWEAGVSARHTGHDRTDQGLSQLAAIGSAGQLTSRPTVPAAHLVGSEAAGAPGSTRGGGPGSALGVDKDAAGPGARPGTPGAQPAGDSQAIPVLVLGKIRGQKKNPNRVGAAWAEQRIQDIWKAQGLAGTSGSDALSKVDSWLAGGEGGLGAPEAGTAAGKGGGAGNGGRASGGPGSQRWLPNFGGVWQSGPRRETLREFDAEQRKRKGGYLRRTAEPATAPLAAKGTANRVANVDGAPTGAPSFEGHEAVSRVKEELEEFEFKPYVSKRQKRSAAPVATPQQSN